MKTSILKRFIISFILIVSLLTGIVHAQVDGSGGLQSIFVHGVGARALSLGNAYVAMPFDASAIYWNPSGLDHIQYKNVMSFYTTLIVKGVNLYYLGYVHPTTNLGTFGVAVFGLGVDGIKEYDDKAVHEGDKVTSEQQFFISYGKQLPWNISAGINLKIHHQNLLSYTATGIGTDVGVLYKPDFTHPFLSGVCVGMTIQNLIGPRLKLKTETDILPINTRLGIAKPILVNEWGPQLTFFMDFEKSDERIPFKFHAGTEFVFRNMAMLRVGMNSNQLSFGAGAVFNNFQLDYSYGKYAENELASSHRISFSIKFGKSKKELIQVAEERTMQEIGAEVSKELKWEREKKITDAMDDGRQYLAGDDFARAIREFNYVMKFESELPGDTRIEEAKQLAGEANKKSNNELEQRVKEGEAKNEKERSENEKGVRLDQFFHQGMAYLESEDYGKAIEEWKRMLEIDANNLLAKERIAEAEAALEKKLLRLINQADKLAKDGKYYTALKVLNNARNLNPDDKKIVLIDQKVDHYHNQLTFNDLYREGYRYYLVKDYARARESLAKALNYEPNNKKVKKLFFDAKARANAKKEPLYGIIKQKFEQGSVLYKKGRYKEALLIWEEIQKEKPYNKLILDYIDMAREKIEQQKTRPNQP